MPDIDTVLGNPLYVTRTDHYISGLFSSEADALQYLQEIPETERGFESGPG